MVGEKQISEIYQNIDNVLNGVSGIGMVNNPDTGRGKLEMNKDVTNPVAQIGAGPSQKELNADMQLKLDDFEKLVTDEDAYQYLTIYFY